MFCMNCGQSLPDGAKFCMKCGTPQGAVSPTEVNSNETINLDGAHTFVPAMCPNCNAHMKVDSSSRIARCDTCGTECLVQDAIKALTVRGNVQVGSATINVNGTNTDNLLQRVEIMLADGDFSGAIQKCDTILDSDPTNGQAYFYLLMSDLKCRNSTDLVNLPYPFNENPYYIKAIHYGDEDLKKELKDYNNEVTTKFASKLRRLKKGDEFIFGSKNNQGISWKVLTVENDLALVISCEILYLMPYHQLNKKITWENCTIRSWLNSSFLEEHFISSERARIFFATNSNSGSFNHFTKAGNQTKDHVFLLSLNEAKRYLSISGAQSLGQWWWLRSPGVYQNFAVAVNGKGKITSDGYVVNNNGGVRPAMWIKLDT